MIKIKELYKSSKFPTKTVNQVLYRPIGVLKPTIELSQLSFDGEVKYLKSNQSQFLKSS